MMILKFIGFLIIAAVIVFAVLLHKGATELQGEIEAEKEKTDDQ